MCLGAEQRLQILFPKSSCQSVFARSPCLVSVGAKVPFSPGDFGRSYWSCAARSESWRPWHSWGAAEESRWGFGATSC